MADQVRSDKLKPFEDLGFMWDKKLDNQVIGECIFCGKADKLYVNGQTGQWDCKVCGLNGNVYSFIEEWYKQKTDTAETQSNNGLWKDLSSDRALPIDTLKAAGIVYDVVGSRWVIPVKNENGTFVNLRFYKKGSKPIGIAGMEAGLWGLEQLASTPESLPAYICEGEFDGIAMRLLLEEAGEEGVVVSVPGCSIFKTQWTRFFRHRHVVACYDNDVPGKSAILRVSEKIGHLVKSFKWVDWPKELKEGYDIRDFYAYSGTLDVLRDMIKDFEIVMGTTPDAAPKEVSLKNDISSRPTFEQTLEVYEKWLHMTPELVVALKIIYAVIYTNQMGGDPLWVHLAGPPGTGKTELLMSCCDCDMVEVRSTVTPHSLVSGFQMNGGKDPSLIPELIGKTFMVKDFTEVLQMPRNVKDEVYHILRGAYDGSVYKQFGNGIVREYSGYFSMVTGVTQAIFGENGTSLGERFLIYHLIKGVHFDTRESILAAMDNSGDEKQMKSEISTAANAFLNYKIDPKAAVSIPDEYIDKIIALAQIVAVLRATISRDVYNRDRITFRDQPEMPTRLAKQFRKLMAGLALLETPAEVTPEVYRIVARVALDTCIGFNLELVRRIAGNGTESARELSDQLAIPLTTCREQLENLTMLGALVKKEADNPNYEGRGRATIVVYELHETMEKYWKTAGLLTEVNPDYSSTPKLRQRFQKKREGL